MPGSARRIGDDPEVGGRQSGVSKTPDALIGTVIDQRYRIDALLGEGGMGLVYRATHTQLHKTVAIKVLRRENVRDEEVLARFRREAESASNIGNEHIVDINDFGTLVDGSTYFVMECLEGLDLIEAIDAVQRLPEERAIHIARQICIALGAAHEAGIVHRDLKPENVFLIRRGDDDNFVKVLDFGIAKVANRPHRLTRDGEVLGTPHYMSPEQCAGDDIDHRTDIYALGVLLYEMVTGHVPHDADTMMGILTKHMYEDPVTPRLRVPKVSHGLERVILRSLEKKPEARYGTMDELDADLARVQSGQTRVGPDTIPLRPAPRDRRGRRIPILGGMLALIVMAIVALAAFSSAFESGESPQEGANAPVAVDTPVTESTKVGKVSEPSNAETPQTAGREDRPEASAEPPREARERRKSRRTPKPSSPSDHGDGPILDPWK